MIPLELFHGVERELNADFCCDRVAERTGTLTELALEQLWPG